MVAVITLSVAMRTAMVDKSVTLGRNVIDIRSYRQARMAGGKAQAISARTCKHCGAGLMDGESEDDCSSAGISAAAPIARKFYAD
jgi:formaldehyde-activating enzyme involved in methanogenesis